MAAEKKPSIYQDRGTIGSSSELDKYGVWVKSEPQDLSTQDDLVDTFEPAWEKTISEAEVPQDPLDILESADLSADMEPIDLPEAEAEEPFVSADLSSLDSLESTDSLEPIDLPEAEAEEPFDSTGEATELELPDMDDLAEQANISTGDDTPGSVDDFIEETEGLSTEEASFLSDLKIAEETDFSIFDEIADENIEAEPEVSTDLPEETAVPDELPPDTAGDDSEIEDISIDLDLDEVSEPVLAIEEEDDDSFGTAGPGSVDYDETDEKPNLSVTHAEAETHEKTTPREAELSTQLLVKIADELSSIRSELSDLKQELAGLKTESFRESGAAGFFHKTEQEDDDEKIALTGDEMSTILNTEETLSGDEVSNILNTAADIETVEGFAEPEPEAETINEENETPVEPQAQGFFSDDEDETIALTGDEMDNILNSADFIEETGADAGEEITESEDIAEAIPSEDTAPEAEDTVVNEEPLIMEEETPELKQIMEEGVRPMNSPPEPEEAKFLEKDPLIVEELEAGILDLSDAVIDEPDLSSGIQDNPVTEPSLEDISIDLELDESGIEDVVVEESNPESGEDSPLDPLAASLMEEEEIEIPLDEGEDIPIPPEAFDSEDDTAFFSEDAAEPLAGEDLAIIPEGFAEEQETEPEQVIVEVEDANIEEPAASIEEPSPIEDADLPDEVLVSEDASLPEEPPTLPEAGASQEADASDEAGASDEAHTSAGIIPPVAIPVVGKPAEGSAAQDSSSGLKQELKNVLSYMDDLLESLPDDKIEEFARSEYFDTYKKLFKELGLV